MGGERCERFLFDIPDGPPLTTAQSSLAEQLLGY
jgi:hypothetical protein